MNIVERASYREGWKASITSLSQRLWKKKGAAIGLIVILVVVAFSAFPGLFATHSPYKQNLRNQLQPPNSKHILGTDNHGRDLYSRLVHGARISLAIGVLATGGSAILGIILGLVSGYFGGLYDRLITMVVEWILAFPTILLAISILAVLGSGLTNMVIVIALVGIPHFARVVRSQVLSIKNMEFVEAARATGTSAFRIMFRHILPNGLAAIIVLASMRIATAILAEAALSFLGLGLAPPTPSWGIMIAEGRQHLATGPWVALFPGVFIMLTVLAFNLFGDGVRDMLDPRLKL